MIYPILNMKGGGRMLLAGVVGFVTGAVVVGICAVIKKKKS